MKALKIIFAVIAIMGILIYLIFPWNMTERGYWTPAWWKKCLFNFCKYQSPGDYEAISYSEGGPNHRGEKYLIILKSGNTGQLILLSRLRGFDFIPFEQIRETDKLENSFNIERSHILDNFKVVTYMPILSFLRQDNLDKIPDNLTLKGITIEEKEEYETTAAKVLYIKGTFTKIGFFKKMPIPWGFATPVFDFLTPQRGAIAILNNKEKEETIIVVSAVPLHKEFDEKTFKTFISSITFDKEVYEPALLKGLKQKPKTKVKYSLR